MKKLVLGTTVLALALAACGGGETTNGGDTQQEGPATVSVQAQEYEFTGVPDEVAAGSVTFQLENVGQEQHELQLARITTDLPVEDIVALPQEEAEQNIEPVGGTFAEPGASAEFQATLEPGRYGYVCFVQTPEGEPHAALGMFGELTVE